MMGSSSYHLHVLSSVVAILAPWMFLECAQHSPASESMRCYPFIWSMEPTFPHVALLPVSGVFALMSPMRPLGAARHPGHVPSTHFNFISS